MTWWNWLTGASTETRRHWPLDLELGRLSPNDPWRLSDAVTGTMILGSTGSGKSSGPGRRLLMWLMRAGLGGLVLCVKSEDRSDVERLAAACGRQRDLVIFGPDRLAKFNLLEFELLHGGGDKSQRLENVVQLFQTILEITERNQRGHGSSGENRYFERAALQLLRGALLALILAEEPVTLENIHRFITTAPHSQSEAYDIQWRERSYCYLTLCRADDRPRSASLNRDFEMTILYWLNEFASMDPKPRSGIVSTYTTMADVFSRGVMRDTFFGETTITPEACRHGKIIVLDFPTLRWNEVGRIAQAAFKFVWQRAMERGDARFMPRPVFLYSDEAQQFLTSFDTPFQATARSSRVCTVYISQNLPGLYESVGGEAGRHAIDGLLGNLRLKLFCAQDDPITCQWQSELCGKTKRFLFNGSTQTDPSRYFEFIRTPSRLSGGFSESWEYEIQPWEWARDLRTGGKHHRRIVDCIAFQGGTPWNASGTSYQLVSFTQD